MAEGGDEATRECTKLTENRLIGDLVVSDELMLSDLEYLPLALRMECIQSSNVGGKQSPCLGCLATGKPDITMAW